MCKAQCAEGNCGGYVGQEASFNVIVKENARCACCDRVVALFNKSQSVAALNEDELTLSRYCIELFDRAIACVNNLIDTLDAAKRGCGRDRGIVIVLTVINQMAGVAYGIYYGGNSEALSK